MKDAFVVRGCVAGLLVVAVTAGAQSPGPGLASRLAAPAVPAPMETVSESTPRDPWLPPHARPKRATASVEPPTTGAALKAQVERKLRTSFEAADVERRGSVTRDQARAAGLGLVVREFDRIDTAQSGRVSFEDLKRFLRL